MKTYKTELNKRGTYIYCDLDEMMYSVSLDGLRLPLNDLIEYVLENLEGRGAEGRAIAAAINIDELASLLDEFAVEEEE